MEDSKCIEEGCTYDKAEGYEHCHQCLAKMQEDLVKRVKQSNNKAEDTKNADQ